MQCFATRFVRSRVPVVLALLVSLVPLGQLLASEGTKIDGFTLPDTYGRERTLDEFKDSPIVVVAFLGAECPLARLYGPRLQELADEYAAKGVAFVGIDANHQDTLTDMTGYARQYGVKFPLLKDRDGSIADKFGAVRNPEVFVLDRNRVVRYRGRVDDQYGLGASSGYAKPVLKERNLGNALDELLEGKSVSQTVTQVTGCIIGRTAKVAPKGTVTYTKDIASIMQKRCEECHRPGQVGPFALTDYESVQGWGAMIKEVVSDGRMPPWSANPQHGKFGNDPRLSDEEKATLFAWVDNGCPQGDLADLPKPKQWTEGWRISKPDEVFYMQEAFKIPAEGVINYKNFSVETNWTEDKWIQECEIQPGAWGNVHHIICSISPGRGARPAGAFEGEVEGAEPIAAPGQGRGGRGARGARGARNAGPTEGEVEGAEPIAQPRGGRGGRGRNATPIEGLDAVALRGGRVGAFIPGRNPTIYQPGTAFFAPKGSRITFQMHYTTNGKEAEDISRIGLVYADPKTVKYLAYTGQAGSNNLRIPPYDPDYKVDGETVFRKDTRLIVLHPHMHLRGKSMTYTAHYPDGTSEILLDVPRYDFNWQFEYELAEPKFMPAGTRLHVAAAFDNSVDNVANPDPSKEIHWGPQSWDEMMIGYYTTITPLEDALAAKAAMEKAQAQPNPQQ